MFRKSSRQKSVEERQAEFMLEDLIDRLSEDRAGSDLYAFSIISHFKNKLSWPIFKDAYKRYKLYTGKRVAVINKITDKNLSDLAKAGKRGTIEEDICILLRFLQEMSSVQSMRFDNWSLRSHLKRISKYEISEGVTYTPTMLSLWDDTFLKESEKEFFIFNKKNSQASKLVDMMWESDNYRELYLIPDAFADEGIDLPDWMRLHCQNDTIHSCNCKVIRTLRR